MSRVLVIGGRGQIGRGVIADLLAYTSAHIIATGRTFQSITTLNDNLSQSIDRRVEFLGLDLADLENLETAIATSNLVIHCAGPFRHRDHQVLKTCIAKKVSYLDVSDDWKFTRKALEFSETACSAGITAIVNTGLFPGISNSMVRQGIEQLSGAESIHLRYVVAGSGGAGTTAMQTTFLNLLDSFEGWINGAWQSVKPYTGREIVQFPPPFDQATVYWFDLPEAHTLPMNFPVKTVTVKFGSVPSLYNDLSRLVAHAFPPTLLQNARFTQLLSRISLIMTSISDRFSGKGVAIRLDIHGNKDGKTVHYGATFTHPNAAISTGQGTGSLAELILSGQIIKPGVWTVEQALPTQLFEQVMRGRKNTIQTWFD